MVICSHHRSYLLFNVEILLLMKRFIIAFLVIVALVMIFVPDISAQCPMCKMTVETNLKEGGSAGRGINRGILYLLAMPYICVGTIYYIWKKNNKQGHDDNEITQ